MINYRKTLILYTIAAPHDPKFQIDLSTLEITLAFSDTATHHAYRALLLIDAGLETRAPQQSKLTRSVRKAIADRLYAKSWLPVIDELRSLQVRAYRCLAQGLLHCMAFWDGLTVVKLALEKFPDDAELLDLEYYLLMSFKDRHARTMEEIKDGHFPDAKAAIAETRPGRIYQKPYPWMAQKLFVRSPRLVRQVNSTFASRNAEVRPVVFGAPGTPSKSKSLSGLPKNADVGPLGIFAKRDIKEGEAILADKSFICVSDIDPTTRQFCDACHAVLAPPFTMPFDVCRPSCGCKIAFCCKACHDMAVGRYHKIQCGVDFSWLYGSEEFQNDWDPIMFLRVISIVLSTPGWTKDSVPQKNPLQHPLVARLTANYGSKDKQDDHAYNWYYNDNIIAPTRILMDLGVDIFSPAKGNTKLLANIWTPELIQTIYWRMLNNANTSTINITALRQDDEFGDVYGPASDLSKSRFGMGNAAHLISISPDYSFFNHSCRNNVAWKGTCLDGTQRLSSLIAGDGDDMDIMKPGASVVICRAARDIKAGEELTISYAGDPMGDYTEEELRENSRLVIGEDANGKMSRQRLKVRVALSKWFDDGCGCGQCKEENETGKMPGREKR